MKTFFISSISLVVIILLFQKDSNGNHIQNTSKKVALLVGVSEYSKHYKTYMRWSPTSAYNDIKYLKTVLIRNGYSQFIILENENATFDNIRFALFDSLPSMVNAGDYVHFHFSGHGQRIFDNNADEIDGLDESIVPFDAAKLYKENVYSGEKHIRDDDLRSDVDLIRKKLGSNGHMTVTIDACYSGSSLRSDVLSKTRGTELILESEQHKRRRKGTLSLEKGFEGFSNSEDLAPLVAFFGSSMDELNYECRSEANEEIGSLSYAYCKARSSIKSNKTYSDLFDEIVHIMTYKAPFQNPQAEGSLNNILGISQASTSHEANDVLSITKRDSTLVIKIKKGLIDGYASGDKVKLMSQSLKDEVLLGYIKYADLTTSELVFEEWDTKQVIEKDDIKIDLVERKIVPNSKIYASSSLRSYLQNDQSVAHDFEKFEFVDKQTMSDLVLEYDSLVNKIVLSNVSGTFKDSVHIKNCFEAVDLYFRAELLRNLDARKIGISADVSLRLESKNWEALNRSKLNLDVGDRYKIQIKNDGEHPFYFSLIYIDNSNSIYVDIPRCDEYNNCSHTAEEMKLEPNESIIFFQVFTVDYPLGIDVIKLITASNPVDLSQLSNDRSHTKLKENTIEYLFNEINKKEELDSKSFYSLPNNTYTIETIILEISK